MFAIKLKDSILNSESALTERYTLQLIACMFILIYALTHILFPILWPYISASQHHSTIYNTYISHFVKEWKLNGLFQYQIRSFDNPSYITIAQAIKTAHYQLLPLQPNHYQYHLWGLPIMMAIFSSLLGVNLDYALLIISLTSSLGAIYFISRRYGSLVGIYFSVINCAWLQLSVFGGAEPLFMLVLISGFYIYNKKTKYSLVTASVLLAYASIVRPFGVLALIAVGFDLLLKQQYRKFLISVVISLLIAGVYLLFVGHATGNPLYNFGFDSAFRTYNVPAVPGIIFLYGLWLHIISHPILNSFIILAWILFIALGVRLVFCARKKIFRSDFRAEYLFFIFYITSFLCIPPFDWICSIPRYVIPVIPLVLYMLKDTLKPYKFAISALGIFTATMSVFSFYGIYFIMHHIHI